MHNSSRLAITIQGPSLGAEQKVHAEVKSSWPISAATSRLGSPLPLGSLRDPSTYQVPVPSYLQNKAGPFLLNTIHLQNPTGWLVVLTAAVPYFCEC